MEFTQPTLSFNFVRFEEILIPVRFEEILIPAFDRNGQKSSSRGLAVISLAIGKGGN